MYVGTVLGLFFFDTASNEVPLCEMFLAGRNQHPPINALFQDPIKGIKDVNHTSSETIANCLKIKVHFTKEVPLLLQHNLANQGLWLKVVVRSQITFIVFLHVWKDIIINAIFWETKGALVMG